MSKPTQLERVAWRDLVVLSPSEKAWELTLGLPWLALSVWCYGRGWWWAGLGCSFYVFRGRWLNLISYSMFFHAEHHLFPAVPTAHLAELARRLDAVAPEIRQRPVLALGEVILDGARAGAAMIGRGWILRPARTFLSAAIRGGTPAADVQARLAADRNVRAPGSARPRAQERAFVRREGKNREPRAFGAPCARGRARSGDSAGETRPTAGAEGSRAPSAVW